MQDLIKQEQFEIEVLDRLNSKKLLNNLIFGGGSMLRLCFGLDRFSANLDFWIIKKGINRNKLFKETKKCLAEQYTIKDATNKFYIILFEIRSRNYPRSLKIEIRKETKKIDVERAIAYSKFSNTQVILNVVKPQQMMRAKIQAFLDRGEIRDIFDVEFLFKKGVMLDQTTGILKDVLEKIGSLSKNDYTVKLGPLLEEKQRRYYITEGFKIIRMAIEERMRQKG